MWMKKLVVMGRTMFEVRCPMVQSLQGVRLFCDLFKKAITSSIIDLGQKFLMVSAIYGQTFWKMEKKFLKIFEKIAKLSKNNQRWRHSSSQLTNGKLLLFGIHKTPG